MALGAFLLVSIPVALLLIFFFQRWRLLATLIEEINILRGGPDVSEKSLKMSRFRIFTCRPIGGNVHPWTPGGAGSERLQQNPVPVGRSGVSCLHPGRQNGNPG